MDRIDGRYVLGRQLGAGGMGAVFEARDERLQRRVAVKLLLPHFAADEEYRLRFEREALTAGRIKPHSHVVPLLDFGRHRSQLYLVMAFVDGIALSDLIPAGLPLPQVRRLAQEIGSGLDAIHGEQVVHSDVKPGNVLLDGTSRPAAARISDFGLAQPADLSQRLTSGSAHFTPAYVAPERVRGGPPSRAADVYSFACLLFECLTGRPPYQGANGPATAYLHVQGAIPDVRVLRPPLPPAVADVLTASLSKRPEQRPASAGELASTFAAALGTAGSGSAPPPSPRPRPAVRPPTVPLQEPDRSSRRALALLAALALLGGGTALALAQQKDDPPPDDSGAGLSAVLSSPTAVGDCARPVEESEPDYSAVACAVVPPGADEVTIRRYADAAAMRAAFADTRYAEHPRGDCAQFAGGPGSTGSGVVDFWGFPEQPRGCFVNANGHASVVWGSDELAVLVAAVRYDHDSRALHTWWTEHAESVLQQVDR